MMALFEIYFFMVASNRIPIRDPRNFETKDDKEFLVADSEALAPSYLEFQFPT